MDSTVLGIKVLGGDTFVRTNGQLIRLDQLSGTGPAGHKASKEKQALKVPKVPKVLRGPQVQQVLRELQVQQVQQGLQAQQVKMVQISIQVCITIRHKLTFC